MKILSIFLIVLGLSSLIVFAMPEILVLLMFTIVGIPIAIVMMLSPALFLVLFIGTIVFCMIPGSKLIASFLSAAIVGAILAIPPIFLNVDLDDKAKAFILDDRNDLKLPLSAKKIAVRTKSQIRYGSDRGITRCDGFCLHALLSGSAKSILVAETKHPFEALAPQTEALEFTLERLPQCPSTEFKPGHHNLNLRSKAAGNKRSASAIELIKLRISDGECLVSKKASLTDADIVITRGRLVSADRPEKRQAFGFDNKTITADRMMVHEHNPDNGTFKEVYRWTGVRYEAFGKLMVPAPVNSSGFKILMGWWKDHRRLNINTKYYQAPNWPKFLVHTLGLDLHLNGEKAKDRVVELATKILADNRAPSPGEWDAISEYFGRIGIGKNTKLEAADAKVAFQLLADKRFPAPPRLYNVVTAALQIGSPSEIEGLVDSLFSRLENGNTWSASLNVSENKNFRTLAWGLNRVPDKYFLPHFERHVGLASVQNIRVHARQVVSKLHVHGERAVPTLMDQVVFGVSHGSNHLRSNEFQHPYLAGMTGLCLAGEKAQSALPKLLELMNDEKLPAYGSYGGLLVNALVRVGADPELVWPTYSGANQNRTRKNFDHEVRRGKSDRPDCSY